VHMVDVGFQLVNARPGAACTENGGIGLGAGVRVRHELRARGFVEVLLQCRVPCACGE
jgi:hypothetical protein